MNGQRIVRNYIERLTDTDLYGLWDAAKDDSTNEGLVIYYLIISEIERRKRRFMKELHEALTKLGVTGTVTTEWITTDRILVHVDDEYFGIWDTVRKTFVD